jgi:hypothetical protein
MGLQVMTTGFRAGSARGKLFGDDFESSSPAAKAIVAEHRAATGDERIARGGYPDTGNGRYSQALSYKDWLQFNNAQRAHMNYVEGAASAIALNLLAGVGYPRASAALGVAYIVGREAYTWGYIGGGADKRVAGAIILDTALLGMFVAAVTTGVRMARGLKL